MLRIHFALPTATRTQQATVLGLIGCCAFFFAVTTANSTAIAKTSQSSAGRAVIASGGGTSTGGNFAIDGTIGQADVDPLQPSTGGAFAITGGFWFTESPRPDGLFGDGFENP